MKKFIEELKKTGDYQAIMHSVMDAREMFNDYSEQSAQEAITKIVRSQMMRNKKLFDVFVNDTERLAINKVCNDIIEQIVKSEEEASKNISEAELPKHLEDILKEIGFIKVK